MSVSCFIVHHNYSCLSISFKYIYIYNYSFIEPLSYHIRTQLLEMGEVQACESRGKLKIIFDMTHNPSFSGPQFL